ncbi:MULTISPECIES: PDR/VanB family oxidoreductase [Paraburkholderia]|uniref:PDR/VanB family oxidoreductase n=1 Tax=Paraburkholderia TaxID=1822464 RepID=UPI00225897EF|nr:MULTISPECIES: PDR/VanB family oxidoreductase [Paraburkholderia]MCX4176976.1 PDR/VanB family oxidoreductase [Paraburkholderia madseniana]MDQ6464966.1 PDR/VanB family oxidoreductase [Paraburkholderia madseniana]
MNCTVLNVVVARKKREAIDITSFELANEDGRPLPSFAAGAHIDVHLPGGVVRQYSLCNDPSETHRYLIAVLRDASGRGGSKAIHDLVHEGDRLQVSTPRNHFVLADHAPHHLLLAGGIGVTPILCMAERLVATGQPFDMHYCTRSADRTAFAKRITEACFSGSVRFHHDDNATGPTFDLSSTLARAPGGTHLYVCGPRGFMDAVLAEARSKGWPEDRLHYEFFGAIPGQTAGDKNFQVRIASSGATVEVAADCTVVQALAAHGIEVLTSCEQGVCGTCLTRVIDGEPDHRDSYLTSDEQAANDQFLPCCSRSKSELLVLDL